MSCLSIFFLIKVFDNTPAAREGTLEAGDELVGVNGVTVKGKTKVEVARMIQATQGDVSIKYNKLHADPKQGKTLDEVNKYLGETTHEQRVHANNEWAMTQGNHKQP